MYLSFSSTSTNVRASLGAGETGLELGADLEVTCRELVPGLFVEELRVSDIDLVLPSADGSGGKGVPHISHSRKYG